MRIVAALGMLAGSLLIAISSVAARQTPPIHALVVGIDNYNSLRKLEGAANDARDISSSLRAIGARDVVVLLDAQASRAEIVKSFRELAARAKVDGGWLVFAYAGHGGQEPERIKSDEADGRDEAFLLAGYANSGTANAERIVDNDLYSLFAAVDPNVPILFIADSCHSGTMTRSVDARARPYSTRSSPYGPILADSLPPPPAESRSKSYAELPNVIFVASATDSEATVELPIEGMPRGAVSWYMARAFEGRADANGNGVTTFGELRQYIGVTARNATENRQHPTVNFLPGRDADALPFASNKMTGGNEDTELARIGVWVSGGSTSLLNEVPGAIAATSARTADLLWDKARGQVLNNALGDVLAEQPAGRSPQSFIAGVTDKWRALRELKLMSAAQPLAISIGPRGEGALYSGGQVEVAVAQRSNPALKYLTLINLAGDGTVQWLFPSSDVGTEAGPLPASARPGFATKVGPPYGADHVIAIATTNDPRDLRQQLRVLDGQLAATSALTIIRTALNGQAHAIGVAGLYTGK